ncbi:humps family-domain-containing protein [Auriculariales sp. MPI-PUGE-AT-0066]|nr:humps family-domain-containing protein [Auriculariales sp. MPI-PUGE-AT-0066]
MASTKLSYGERALRHNNPAAQALLETMDRKKTNLCVSVDVTSKSAFLAVVDAVGPYVCLIKLHDFLIFEDRKFADIGNTVSLQYSGGVYRIASWSHITNAHTVPGPGIIAGLAKVGLPLGRGLLLLAEMSSAGTLAAGSYSEQTIAIARANRDFVVGFIAMKRPTPPPEAVDEDFLVLTPGVQIGSKGDALGQHGCDVIIVGRGITGSGESISVNEVKSRATLYREEGWKAYLERIQRVS